MPWKIQTSRRKRSLANQTCNNVEFDRDYWSGQITIHQAPGVSDSWTDCQLFCRSNGAKYFTWIGPNGSDEEYSCWCRNVKGGGFPVSGRVFGETCDNSRDGEE